MIHTHYDIGIVIVSYNVRHFLSQCLQSIYNSNIHGLQIGIWVVDNASVDGSAEWITQQFPGVKWIQNEVNVGFSKANNQAIMEIRADHILLLNPDTLLEENTLYKCYEFMKKHPDAGAMGVRMIDGAGKFLPESKRKIPDVWSSFCRLSYLSDLFPRSKWFSGYYLGHLPEFETHQIEVLCGAFMFIRSQALEQTGLLDENFFMYGEDIDLSYRILKAGWKIYYYPETSIIHYKGESTKKSSLNYIKTFYGAMSIYVNKHYSRGSARWFARFINLAIFLRALISGFGKLLSVWTWPLVDGIAAYGILIKVKNIWAQWYFNDLHYYDNSPIGAMLATFLFIWILGLWIGGHYDNDQKVSNSLQSVIGGTVVILILYALLPDNMRVSRALILIGALVVFITSFLTCTIKKYLWQSKKTEDNDLHLGIVADKAQAQKLTELWLASNDISTVFSYFSPNKIHDDSFFTNNFSHLPLAVETLRIDEIIFSSDSVKMKDIIESMTNLPRHIRFRISSLDSLIIIGSHDRNKKGELFNLDINYNLSSPSMKRLKRILDIFVSLIIFVFHPFLIILTGFKAYFLTNIYFVISGQKTWVGYGGDEKDHIFLPSIPQSVISYPHSHKLIQYTDGYFKRKNMEYARNYNLWVDIKTIFGNIQKIADRGRKDRKYT